MEIAFDDLLKKIVKKTHYNECFYNVVHFENEVERLKLKNISIDNDYLITPYYICKDGTYEMYWHEFTIRLVDSPSFEGYILAKTGSKKLYMVEKNVEKKLKKQYLEVIRPNTTFPIEKLHDYIKFIECSDEVEEDVVIAFRKIGKFINFDKNKLFFDVY